MENIVTRLVRNLKAFALKHIHFIFALKHRHQGQIAISQDKNVDALL